MSDARQSENWTCTPESLHGGRAIKYAPRCDGSPVAFRDVLRRWQSDHSFRAFFVALLAEAPFAGFRWETPPVKMATADRAFEFVLLDAPGLDRTPDVDAFADQFQSAGAGQPVVTFQNLGGDAVLVVPCQAQTNETAYVHLASFVRGAPPEQVHELWRAVGAAMEARLGAASPVWLSTAGMGVAWLHVRLDSRPKYYGFAPYRDQR